jgi:hypothetical protein
MVKQKDIEAMRKALMAKPQKKGKAVDKKVAYGTKSVAAPKKKVGY